MSKNDERNRNTLSSITDFLRTQTNNGRGSFKLNKDDVDNNPTAFALMAKLNTTSLADRHSNRGELSDDQPNYEYLMGLSAEKAQEIDDNEAIMQLLPDLKRGAEILISYILSPKYLMKPKLEFGSELQFLGTSLTQELIDVVKKYILEDYSLEGKIYGILYEVLFTKGAYVLAVIPEASLDEIMNPELVGEHYSAKLSTESMESIVNKLNKEYRKSFGFLGQPDYSPTAKSTPLISVENLQVGHGTDEQTNSIHQDKYYSKIHPPVEYVHSFHKDLFLGLSTESMKEMGLDEEGNWSIKFEEGLDSMIEVSDDLSILHEAFAMRLSREQYAMKSLGLSNEDFSSKLDDSDRALMKKLFKDLDKIQDRGKNDHAVSSIKTNDQTYRKNLAEPLIINYPVESVIPVYKPGTPSEHIGYLVLHDEEGNPVSKTKPINYYRELNNTFNTRLNSRSMASSLIQQGRHMFDGFGNRLDESRQLEILSKVHGNAIIRDILERFRKGIYGKNLDIGDVSEAFKIMFYRSLRSQRTKVLFIPSELTTYFAFDYDTKGMGRSLLDNMKVLLSLRIQFLLAQVRAGITNSIPETLVTVKIDEHDPDPRKTISIAQEMALRSRSSSTIMVGASNVQTIEDQVNAGNIRINIDSDNPKVPDVNQEFNRTTADIPQPDQDTAEKLEKYTTLGIGLSPETIENSYQADFATQIIQGNQLNTLTSSQKNEQVKPFLSKFAKTVCNSSPLIRNELTDLITRDLKDILKTINDAAGNDVNIEALSVKSRKALVERIVNRFISSVTVSLPKPIDDNPEMKNEQLRVVEEKVDNLIRYYLSDEALPGSILGDDAGNFREEYLAVIKAKLIQQWMLDNDYHGGVDIAQFFTTDDNGVQTFGANKEARSDIITIAKAIMEFAKGGKNIKDTIDAVAKTNQLQGDDDYGGGSYDSGSSDSGGSDDDGGDSEGGGGDDLFGDDDFDFDGGGDGDGGE